METMPKRVAKDITSQKMIKRRLMKDITDSLQPPNKFLSKKKRQINKSKLKASIGETSSRKDIIGSGDCFEKKELLVPIPATKKGELKIEDINIDMIDVNSYHRTCHLKPAQVFAVLIEDIEYQTGKETRVEIDLKSVVPQEYHHFLDVFLKKNSDNFILYQKYDHKILLEKE